MPVGGCLFSSKNLDFAMPTPASSTDSCASGRGTSRTGSNLRLRLRSATAEAHARLDARFGGLDLTRLSDYRLFLEASAAALLPLESALVQAGVARIFPDWPSRTRRHAILNDLADVDGEFRPLQAPDDLDFGGVLGAMYVLEGSRLGARMLVQQIKHAKDPRIAAATAYLRHGEGEPLWPSFLETLERRATSLDSDASVIDGALQAFALFDSAAARIWTANDFLATRPAAE